MRTVAPRRGNDLGGFAFLVIGAFSIFKKR